MNEIEELEAADTAANCAYIEAGVAYKAARSTHEAAEVSLKSACSSYLEARTRMFSAVADLNVARDYKED